MNIDDYRAQQQSGIPADADGQDAADYEQDAEAYNENEPEGDAEYEEGEEEAPDDQADVEADDSEDDGGELDLPEGQKTAFQKALEREKRKMQAERERERAELEQRYNPYKTFFDQLGIEDPTQAMQAVREQQERQRLQQQAQQYAYEYGWDEQQAEQYIQQQMAQQKQQEELQDLRVSVQINELASNKDYVGIKDMKPQIKALILESGGRLTAEQAYWAIGGRERAAQMKREAEQREIAKRAKGSRTVQKDTPGSPTGGAKPLPDDVVAAAREAGISQDEARRLMEMPNDLEGYRKWKAKNKRRA